MESRIAVVVGEVEAAHGVVAKLPVESWGWFVAETACSLVCVLMARVWSGDCVGGGGDGEVA